jgi:hypothetical protein
MTLEDFLDKLKRIDDYIYNNDYKTAFIEFVFLMNSVEEVDRESLIIYYKNLILKISKVD